MFSVLLRGASNNIRITPVRFLSSNLISTGSKSLKTNCPLTKNVNKSATLLFDSSKNLLMPKNNQVLMTSIRNVSLSPKRMGAVDHSKLWTIERMLAVSLLSTLPLAIAVPNPVLDTVAAISIVMHQYWGLEAIFNDYIRPIIFGHTIPKIAHVVLIGLTLATLGGLFYFNYNDIGIGRAIRRVWSLGKNPPPPPATST